MRMMRELRAICGERQFGERAGLDMAAERAEQLHDIAANQRFAAGDPELADAAATKAVHRRSSSSKLSKSRFGKKFMSSDMQ